MMIRTTLAACVCLCACTSERTSSTPAAPAEVIFEYAATDGEVSFGLRLLSDGRWSRREHSGAAIPEGRLSPEATRAFLALVAKAPFRTENAPCDTSPIGSATFNDRQHGRSAHASQGKDANGSWVPCGDQVDEATRQLPGCLEMLIDGHGAEEVPSCAVVPVDE